MIHEHPSVKNDQKKLTNFIHVMNSLSPNAEFKLRRLNRLKAKFGVKSDSYCFLIDFFDPNLSSESQSLRQNQFERLRNSSTSLNLIKRDQKFIEFDRKS